MIDAFRLVDADNHYYELADAFTRYIEPKFADRAIHVRYQDGEIGRIWFGDRPTEHVTTLAQDRMAAPGAAAGVFEGRSTVAEMLSQQVGDGQLLAYVSRDARLELMDELNLEAALLFPTIGLAVEHDMRSDPEACVANLRSFNSWIADEWGFGGDGRLFAVAVISPIDVPAAAEEVDRVLSLGARAILMTPGPVNGASLGHPCFDPIWSRIAEAGALVAFHVGNSGYLSTLGPILGVPAGSSVLEWTALSRFLFFRDRPVSDTIAAMILQNVFGRHPGLRVVSAENSAHWVPWTLGHMDRVTHAVGGVETFGAPQPDRSPSEIFREHVYVAPNPQEDILGLVDLIGPSNVLFGSDFPHPEGLSAPRDFAASLDKLSDREARLILRQNLASLLGID